MIDEFVQYFALIALVYGTTHYTIIKMKKLGVMFVLISYAKWFVGVSVTFFAFYILYLAGNYFKEHDLSTVFSLPVGIFVWFVPMHYISKMFEYLESKYQKKDLSSE